MLQEFTVAAQFPNYTGFQHFDLLIFIPLLVYHASIALYVVFFAFVITLMPVPIYQAQYGSMQTNLGCVDPGT